MNRKVTTQIFIKRAIKIHGNVYDYSLVEYKEMRKCVKIICLTHGEFLQTAQNHIAGSGCPKCAVESRKNTKEKFIERCKKVHNDKYDYTLVNYIRATTKVKIICKDCNKIFSQMPRDHYSGHGCPYCKIIKTTGFWSKEEWITLCSSKNCDPSLYVIRCFNTIENFIKIGITTKSIHKRYPCKTTMPYSYEVLKEIKGSPDFIYDEEKELHKKYKIYKYTPLISFGGETECFNISILQDILKH